MLCLIALFTHNHIYWILGLLLALVQLPDFSTPVASIAELLEQLTSAGAGLSPIRRVSLSPAVFKPGWRQGDQRCLS